MNIAKLVNPNNASLLSTIGKLSVRFSPTMKHLKYKFDDENTLLFFQSSDMYSFPEIGFYGYSEGFAGRIVANDEIVSGFDPLNSTSKELLEMYRAGLSVANYHRIATELHISGDYDRASDSYRAVIEMVGEEHAMQFLGLIDKAPFSNVVCRLMTTHPTDKVLRRLSALAFCGLAMVAVRTDDIRDLTGFISAAMELDSTTIVELHAVRMVALSRGNYKAAFLMAEYVFLESEASMAIELSIFSGATRTKLRGQLSADKRAMDAAESSSKTGLNVHFVNDV